MSHKQAIIDHAYQLGFSLAGVTTPAPPSHLSTYYMWLAAEHHGTMGYLANQRARNRRANPQLLLPKCQTILVLAASYSDPSTANIPEMFDPAGRVAAYAWGEDYHHTFIFKLQKLVVFIENLVGHPISNRLYTDTGPILERDLAQRAGLGWIGKNTCLINPKYGSYFLLAEILLELDLEPDPPFTSDRCGTCTRCIEACPTNCILPNRTIDARRCIAYLTIELKDDVPPELHSQMGNWIFGCDICQMVCPWNRFASREVDISFLPKPEVPTPNLIEEMYLSPKAFNQKFKDSPVKRAKRRGYLRNITIALGNSQHPIALRALRIGQRDSEPLVRKHANWAHSRIKAQNES